MKQDRTRAGSLKMPIWDSVTTHHFFVGPISICASQSGVMSYWFHDTHWQSHSLQTGHVMPVLSPLPNLCWDLREQMTMTINPSAFGPFPSLGRTTEPGTHTTVLKPTVYSAVNTQLSKLKVSGCLRKGHPVTFLALNIPLAPGGWICQQTLSSCAGRSPGPWLSWIWAFRVAKPGLKPGAFSITSFWPSSPRSLSEWAKGSTVYPPFRTQIKDLLFQETFYDPSQQLLLLQGLGSTTYSGRPSPTTLSKWGLPAPITPASPCVTASQHLPQPEFMPIICVYLYIFHPPHSNLMRYQGRNLTASTTVVCGQLRAGDTAGNQHLKQCYPIKGESTHVYHFRFVRDPTH